ncbi:putative phage tail assembly chaperone [Desulfovibrio cuneatus]|uniref:putative phage tail assembly chaperone n=1 Tax=Desulfovibrio cuneatus TaxID=159728 RepID=UPI00040E8F85|nr:putative phage tail assembly chaperone [Desulfovibrio cuneatus]
MEKRISLTANGTTVHFNVNAAAYDKFIDEMEPSKKVGPAKNLLMRTVAAESKEALKTLLETPGMALNLVGALVENYAPDINVTLGE